MAKKNISEDEEISNARLSRPFAKAFLSDADYNSQRSDYNADAAPAQDVAENVVYSTGTGGNGNLAIKDALEKAVYQKEIVVEKKRSEDIKNYQNEMEKITNLEGMLQAKGGLLIERDTMQKAIESLNDASLERETLQNDTDGLNAKIDELSAKNRNILGEKSLDELKAERDQVKGYKKTIERNARIAETKIMQFEKMQANAPNGQKKINEIKIKNFFGTTDADELYSKWIHWSMEIESNGQKAKMADEKIAQVEENTKAINGLMRQQRGILKEIGSIDDNSSTMQSLDKEISGINSELDALAVKKMELFGKNGGESLYSERETYQTAMGRGKIIEGKINEIEKNSEIAGKLVEKKDRLVLERNAMSQALKSDDNDYTLAEARRIRREIDDLGGKIARLSKEIKIHSSPERVEDLYSELISWTGEIGSNKEKAARVEEKIKLLEEISGREKELALELEAKQLAIGVVGRKMEEVQGLKDRKTELDAKIGEIDNEMLGINKEMKKRFGTTDMDAIISQLQHDITALNPQSRETGQAERQGTPDFRVLNDPATAQTETANENPEDQEQRDPEILGSGFSSSLAEETGNTVSWDISWPTGQSEDSGEQPELVIEEQPQPPANRSEEGRAAVDAVRDIQNEKNELAQESNEVDRKLERLDELKSRLTEIRKEKSKCEEELGESKDALERIKLRKKLSILENDDSEICSALTDEFGEWKNTGDIEKRLNCQKEEIQEKIDNLASRERNLAGIGEMAYALRQEQKVMNRWFMKSKTYNNFTKRQFKNYLDAKLSLAPDLEGKRQIIKDVFSNIKREYAINRSGIDRTMLWMRTRPVAITRGILGLGLAGISLAGIIPSGGASLALLPFSAVVGGVGRYVGVSGLWDLGNSKLTTRQTSGDNVAYGLAGHVFYNMSDDKLGKYVDKAFTEKNAGTLDADRIVDQFSKYAKNHARQRVGKKIVTLLATFVPFAGKAGDIAHMFGGHGTESAASHIAGGDSLASGTKGAVLAHGDGSASGTTTTHGLHTAAHSSATTPVAHAAPTGSTSPTGSVHATGDAIAVHDGKGVGHAALEFCRTLAGFEGLDKADQIALVTAVKNAAIMEPEKYGFAKEAFVQLHAQMEPGVVKGTKLAFSADSRRLFQDLLNHFVAGDKAIPGSMRTTAFLRTIGKIFPQAAKI